MTESEIVKWLELVEVLDAATNEKIEERTRIMAMATSITPELSGMPHASGVSDKIGNAAARLADIEKEIDAATDRYIDHKMRVVDALHKLPENEHDALCCRYIFYLPWGEVAKEMGKSTAQVFRYRKNGLKILQNLLNDS